MIYIVRHPETTWNREYRFQGSQEGSITSKGIERARMFVDNLDIEKVDRIYHAKNKRTKYLADLLHTKYSSSKEIEDERLNERSFGEYEGQKETEFKNYVSLNTIDPSERYNWRAPGGESLKDVEGRVKPFLDEVKKLPGDSIVVTSGGVIKAILMAVGKRTLEDVFDGEIQNLSLYEIG